MANILTAHIIIIAYLQKSDGKSIYLFWVFMAISNHRGQQKRYMEPPKEGNTWRGRPGGGLKRCRRA